MAAGTGPGAAAAAHQACGRRPPRTGQEGGLLCGPGWPQWARGCSAGSKRTGGGRGGRQTGADEVSASTPSMPCVPAARSAAWRKQPAWRAADL
jgi:hypothetical protein